MSATLLIETSGPGGAVGLAIGGVIQKAPLDESRRHARDLAFNVQALLSTCSLKPSDVTSVVVGLGPGSYTGLRVGLASAKAFAFAVGCPLVAVPTFAALAEDLPVEVDEAAIVADALKGMVFHQRYRREPHWCAVSDLAIVAAVDCKDRIIVGPGARPTLEGLWRASRHIAPLTKDAMFAVEPLYGRGSSAEEKRKAQSESAASASARVS